MSKKISIHVQKAFNVNIAKDLGLVGRQRINVVFKVNKQGAIERIRVRAPHPELEKEVVRVISSLPQMLPGFHKGKPVIVPYTLPIVFQVNNDVSETTATPLIEKMKAMRKQVEIQGNVSDEEQKGFDLLFKAVTGTDFDPALVKDIQTYTGSKKKTKLMEKISDVFDQIQKQGNVSQGEEETLKGFLILVINNGINNPKLKEGVKLVEIPYGVVEEVPVFPGCENTDKDRRKECTTEKIMQYVASNFNTKLANSLGLQGRVKFSAVFKINSEGHVVGIRARAPHPVLEKEAVRVISDLPKMTPGMQKGKAVTVIYTMPIIFEVKE